MQESTEPRLLHMRSEASDPFSFLLQLPDDILLILLDYLPLEDLIRYLISGLQVFSSGCRCEQVCLVLREVVQLYGVYKVRLDTICRRKRINNYMELSQRWQDWILIFLLFHPISSRARESRTGEEVSAYYKVRLYHYTNKFRVKVVDEEEDEYIQTYKVGRKKAELDRLVQRSMKRFSLSGV